MLPLGIFLVLFFQISISISQCMLLLVVEAVVVV